MTQSEANKLMLERFQYFIKKAKNAKGAEDQIKFTDAAHKLYITLTQFGVFTGEEPLNFGS